MVSILLVVSDPILSRTLGRALGDRAVLVDSVSAADAALARHDVRLVASMLDLGRGPDGVSVLSRSRALHPAARRWLLTTSPWDPRAVLAWRMALAHRVVPVPWPDDLWEPWLEPEPRPTLAGQIQALRKSMHLH